MKLGQQSIRLINSFVRNSQKVRRRPYKGYSTMIEDHTPIPVDKFGGLYSRDSFTDSVPQDHFIDCLNTITEGEEIGSRFGFTKSIDF